MAKTNFEKAVDAAKASIDGRKAETAVEDLEMMLPLVGSVMQKAEAALVEARYIRDNLPPELPIVAEVGQAINSLEFTLGKKFQEESARLAELKSLENPDGA